jgi:uncharacterized DUF497 family protein
MSKRFDEAKEVINVAKHSISLARVSDFVEVALAALPTIWPSRSATARCARSAFAGHMPRR